MTHTRSVLLLALAHLLAAGCFPVTERVPGSRGIIEDASGRRLVVGVTSREDVLLVLGEPDEVLDDERGFIYQWKRSTSLVLIVPLVYGILPVPVPIESAVQSISVKFDDRGLLKGVEQGTRRWPRRFTPP